MNSDQLHHDQIMANIANLMAQTAKANKETRWYEATMIIAGTLAVVAIVKLFL